MCNQGFTAEIPEAYLMMLQSSLTQADSPISYIGKAGSLVYSTLLTNTALLEPDSTVKIQ